MKKLDFGVAALDPPARQDLYEPLGADHVFVSDVFSVVSVEQLVLVEAAGSNDEAAIGEGAVAPDILDGEKQGTRFAGTRGIKRDANTTKTKVMAAEAAAQRTANTPQKFLQSQGKLFLCYNQKANGRGLSGQSAINGCMH